MTARSTNSGPQGVHVAAITPRNKTGDLNFGAAFEVIDYLCAARVNGIALFTFLGEYPALSIEERCRFTYLAVKRSRVPLLVGTGSATLDQSLALAREARSAGAGAVILPAPLVSGYDSADIEEFYLQFARQFGEGLPVFLSGGIDADRARRLLDSGRFAGVESDCVGSGALVSNDSLFVAARSAGCSVLSAVACVAPELVMALDRAIAGGDPAMAGQLDAQRQELLEWLRRFPLPAGLKTAVAARGIQTGPLPAPLSPEKQRCLDQFREWLRTWLPATRKVAAHG